MDEQIRRQNSDTQSDGMKLTSDAPNGSHIDAAKRIKILQGMNVEELISFVGQAGAEINDFHQSLVSFTDDINQIERAVKYKGHKARRITADVIILIAFLTIMVLISKCYPPKAGKDQEMWIFWLVLYCLIAFIKETIMISNMKRADNRKKYAVQHAGEQMSRMTAKLTKTRERKRFLERGPYISGGSHVVVGRGGDLACPNRKPTAWIRTGRGR